PEQAHSACHEECCLPSKPKRYPRNEQRSNQRSGARTGVENARRQSAFFCREPRGDHLQRSRKVPRLANSQRKASRAQAGTDRANAWLIDATAQIPTDNASPRRAPILSITRPISRKPTPYAMMKQLTMSL